LSDRESLSALQQGHAIDVQLRREPPCLHAALPELLDVSPPFIGQTGKVAAPQQAQVHGDWPGHVLLTFLVSKGLGSTLAAPSHEQLRIMFHEHHHLHTQFDRLTALKPWALGTDHHCARKFLAGRNCFRVSDRVSQDHAICGPPASGAPVLQPMTSEAAINAGDNAAVIATRGD
jgi:hypothetical protein